MVIKVLWEIIVNRLYTYYGTDPLQNFFAIGVDILKYQRTLRFNSISYINEFYLTVHIIVDA